MVETPGTGAPATPPATPPPAGEAKPFIEQIPQEFRDRPWAKENATTPESFFKFVDNQNSLVGKKGLEPPEKPELYEFKNPESLKDKPRNSELDGKTKALFHSAGVPKEMAEKVVAGFEGLLFEQGKALIEKEAAEDKAFNDFNTKLFGDNKAAVVANAQKILRETLPKEALPMFDKMPAETLAMIIAATHGVFTKYGKEDSFRGGAGVGTGGAGNMDALSAEQRKLMENPGFKDFRHPEHDSLMIKNREIMDKMRALKK